MAETIVFQSLPSRPAPVNTEGLIPWIKGNLFANWQSSVVTILVGGLLLYYVPQFINWAALTATTVAATKQESSGRNTDAPFRPAHPGSG